MHATTRDTTNQENTIMTTTETKGIIASLISIAFTAVCAAILIFSASASAEIDWLTPSPDYDRAPAYDYNNRLTGDDVIQHQHDVSTWQNDNRQIDIEYQRDVDRDRKIAENSKPHTPSTYQDYIDAAEYDPRQSATPDTHVATSSGNNENAKVDNGFILAVFSIIGIIVCITYKGD